MLSDDGASCKYALVTLQAGGISVGENDATFLFVQGQDGESTISRFSGFREGLDEDPPLEVVCFMRGGMMRV